MTKFIIVSILALTLAFSGCAGMSDTEQRTVTGGALGAAGGAIVGAIAGNAGLGAAIGGAVGLGSGFLYGKHKESEQRPTSRATRRARNSSKTALLRRGKRRSAWPYRKARQHPYSRCRMQTERTFH